MEEFITGDPGDRQMYVDHQGRVGKVHKLEDLVSWKLRVKTIVPCMICKTPVAKAFAFKGSESMCVKCINKIKMIK